jgi:hypothetical protein
MKTLKTRVIKNWRTTVIGIILLIFAGILTWNKSITWTEFIAFLPFCLTLIGVKDTLIGVDVAGKEV